MSVKEHSQYCWSTIKLMLSLLPHCDSLVEPELQLSVSVHLFPCCFFEELPEGLNYGCHGQGGCQLVHQAMLWPDVSDSRMIRYGKEFDGGQPFYCRMVAFLDGNQQSPPSFCKRRTSLAARWYHPRHTHSRRCMLCKNTSSTLLSYRSVLSLHLYLHVMSLMDLSNLLM